jgi:hypothetical protein
MKSVCVALMILVAGAPAANGDEKYDVDAVPPVVANAKKTVALMTWPIQENPAQCFPQCYVTVRFIGGRVAVGDVSLYKNRKPWAGDGLIEFRDGDKMGYVDSAGRIAILPRFDRGRPFSCGIAVVVLGETYGYIKKDGSWLVEPSLEWAFDFEEGFASASKGERFGILSTKGEWHLEPQFTRLDPLAGGLFAVREDGEEGFFDPKLKKFIRDGRLGDYYKKPNAEPVAGGNAR